MASGISGALPQTAGPQAVNGNPISGLRSAPRGMTIEVTDALMFWRFKAAAKRSILITQLLLVREQLQMRSDRLQISCGR